MAGCDVPRQRPKSQIPTFTDETARRLTKIPGTGTINATALAAAAGNARAFRRGRDMAAWPGPTPRQMTAGGKPRLPGIGKRGNRYPRKNLIHGARAVLPYLVERETPLGRWARGLLARAHKNVAVVALANKLARIAWAVLAHGGADDAGCEMAAAWRRLPGRCSSRRRVAGVRVR